MTMMRCFVVSMCSRGNQVSYSVGPSKWALCYLRGRAEAFVRGRLTLGHVLGAARKAITLGVHHDDIATLLADYGLMWDAENHEVQLPF
jgi:hypothetical protein